MKTKFLLTTPKKDIVTPMVIENIAIKGEQKAFNLEDGDHIIEMKLADLLAMDIRKGDTVNFLGEECKGVDLTQRPSDTVSLQSLQKFLVLDAVNNKGQKVRVKGKRYE